MAGPMPKQDSTHQDPEKPKKASKRHLALGVGTLLALIAAYVYKQGGKEELLNVIRETLLSLQSLRNYGALGWVIFVVVFIAQLTVCLPGTMVVDVALGNIYGAVLGTAASVLAKTISALVSLFLGRLFGQALGLEFPAALQRHMAAVQKRPLKALFLARMCRYCRTRWQSWRQTSLSPLAFAFLELGQITLWMPWTK
ncbi:unnamed protein product [Durusdinium trenchii]|uniref:TVP38/TMEM64 family membrane protein n=2 Tax=Durusdinium trenchii TaxID=1381693 RepID=A0ABP0SKS8_9DINO